VRLTIALLALTAAVGAGCGGPGPAPPPTVTAGDPAAGLAAIERYGCASCHVVPGVRRAERSWVAPPLERYGRRAYVAGVLPNTQENLQQWIRDPRSVNPDTAMPDLDVDEEDARHISAYLLSLR
jgi:cytochrome c